MTAETGELSALREHLTEALALADARQLDIVAIHIDEALAQLPDTDMAHASPKIECVLTPLQR